MASEAVQMPMPRKPEPEKYCEHCGRRLARKRLRNGQLESLLHFNRRKFCDRRCMASAFDQRPVTSDPAWMTAHHHARKLVAPGPCSKCGAPNASDVHHKNGDWQDNSLENLERICRSCHNREHRRRGACVVCGKPQKGLGYCDKHYQRFKKYGDPLATKTPQRKLCTICGEPAHSRNLCGKHYMQAKRAGTLPPR